MESGVEWIVDWQYTSLKWGGVVECGWKFSDRLPLNGLGWVNMDGSLEIDFP